MSYDAIVALNAPSAPIGRNQTKVTIAAGIGITLTPVDTGPNATTVTIATAGGGSAAPPTTMQADLSVAAHTQVLFRRVIVMQAGQRFTLGEDAVLVGV